MSSIMSPDPTTSVWIETQTWSIESATLVVDQEPLAYGAPASPEHAGRLAVDQHAEDLRRLADS